MMWKSALLLLLLLLVSTQEQRECAWLCKGASTA